MGNIVKSIGKTIKKIGKGISKFIKKIGPALILAAAVWAGVSLMGAGGFSGMGTFSGANFMKGLTAIGSKATSFFMPQMGASESFTDYKQRVGGAAARGGGAVPSDSQLRSDYAKNISQGMTTGDALAYMTKMNLFSTGVKALGGLFEETSRERSERERETIKQDIASVDLGASAMDPMDKYKSGAMMRTPSEPTFGRQKSLPTHLAGMGSQRQFNTSSPSATALRQPGLIERGTPRRLS